MFDAITVEPEMLDAWLSPTTVAEFRRTHLRRRPIARPSCIAVPGALLDWVRLDAVLGASEAPDILVVAAGALLELPAPRSALQLRTYLRRGAGISARHAERSHPALRAVADAFGAALGPAQVQLFVTPGATHGFGWHYDDEDVFIAQTAGIKDYYLRPNTVAADLPAQRDAFGRYHAETSPIGAATLHAGDFLYIPARWWHMAVCHVTSLSVSVGVTPRGG